METQKSLKPKTNDQAFKSLFKEVEGSVYGALLRERILKVMDMTEQSIQNEPEEWRGVFVSPELYTKLIEIVRKNIGFND